MKPDVKDGLDRLFSTARAIPPDISGVETAFETRVLARVRAVRTHVPIFYWAWRLVPVFTAVVIALGAWYYASIPSYGVDMHSAFTADYEETLALNFIGGD